MTPRVSRTVSFLGSEQAPCRRSESYSPRP
jgi:hypothetical protein